MDESLLETSIVKRSECTLYNLIDWYNQQPVGTRVAILVKDFEMCQETVLQNFILLLRFVFKSSSLVFILILIILILQFLSRKNSFCIGYWYRYIYIKFA